MFTRISKFFVESSAFSSEIISSWDGVEAGVTVFHFDSDFLFLVEVELAPSHSNLTRGLRGGGIFFYFFVTKRVKVH